MSVAFHTEEVQFQLEQKRLHKQWISEWVHLHQKRPGNISFLFTSIEHIKLINQEYLNHNYFTDVITFDYSSGERISGDVFISIDQLRINANIYDVLIEDEQRRVMIHGVLHLMGFSDASDEEKVTMRKMENEALHLWLKLSQNDFRI